LPIAPIGNIKEVAVGQTIYFNYPQDHDGCLLKRIDEKPVASSFVAYSQKMHPSLLRGCA